LDICIIGEKLLILRENGLFYINLTNAFNKNNILQITNNENNYNRLLKLNNTCCIILDEEKYELFLV